MILNDTNMISKNYNTKEVASILGLTPLTIKRYIKSGELISYKVGGSRRISAEDLENFIKGHKNIDVYRTLETNIEISHRSDFKNLVNFSQNLKLPTHRWFNIKEGYSEELVLQLIDRFSIKKGAIIDPFLGSGTTALAAAKRGLDFIGFEVNPFLAFLSKVKLVARQNKIDKLHFERIMSLNENIQAVKPKLSIVDKLFGGNIDSVLSVKKYIDEISDTYNREFYKLVFLCSLENSSHAKKDGNGLKYPRSKKVINFKESFSDKFTEMYKDSKIKNTVTNNSLLFNIDSRSISKMLLTKDSNSTVFDFIANNDISVLKDYLSKSKLAIFSPPYMNCFDYTEVYKTELWMGDFVKDYEDMKLLRVKSLSSHLNKKYTDDISFYNSYVSHFTSLIKDKKLWSNKIPFMINAYFRDMKEVIKGMHLLLEDG